MRPPLNVYLRDLVKQFVIRSLDFWFYYSQEKGEIIDLCLFRYVLVLTKNKKRQNFQGIYLVIGDQWLDLNALI